MTYSLMTRSVLLFLVTTCFVLTLQKTEKNSEVRSVNNNNEIYRQQQTYKSDYNRGRRGLFFNKRKPGFFKTLFSVIYEQWDDTKNTYNTINKMINENFVDEKAPTTSAPKSNDPNVTTTEAPYRITRKEFMRIISRNIKGIRRLFNLELKDALKASEVTRQQFRKNASIEVSKYL